MALIWLGLAVTVALPVALAASSPLLAWRDPVYIVAGFAGILGLAAMLVQPLLAAGYLPGLSTGHARAMHRFLGMSLVVLVVTHVLALWLTSPPDVVDALLFVSPTPFSVWGVIAMWAIFGAALLAAVRRHLRLRWSAWRLGHVSLVGVAVVGTVVHALLIEGTMELFSKLALCALALAALIKAILVLRARRV